MFLSSVLDIESDTFDELSKKITFEDVARGRKGATIVDCADDLIPIIRTTTRYDNPVQKFSIFHYCLIDEIKKHLKLDFPANAEEYEKIKFNNAMVEIYDSDYRKMGFHTDQSLDLAENSDICLFSCYENNSNDPDDLRKLKIKNKVTNEDSEILLKNNSIVLFSTATNHKFRHKIVLDSLTQSNNRWLGVTFRCSKTFVRFVNGIPYLQPNQQILRMVEAEETKTFHKCKSRENSEVEFVYPEINYTLSKSDLLPITK